MLLAEIHGKQSVAIVGNEDYLTSCVFGHLRQVQNGAFWRGFASCARTIDGSDSNLLIELFEAGVQIPNEVDIRVDFWPYDAEYGEPDLLLSFASTSGTPVIVLVEVKLYSNKSSTGEDDQLQKYFRFLNDRSRLEELLHIDLTQAELALVYLTERYAAAELSESIALTRSFFPNADRRMLLMQWQDLTAMLERQQPKADTLLGELLAFLTRRQYCHFRDFVGNHPPDLNVSGSFYETGYFECWPNPSIVPIETEGFYGR